MSPRGVIGLMRQVGKQIGLIDRVRERGDPDGKGSRERRGLASVPHHARQKPQIGSRDRAAEQREFRSGSVAIRILHIRQGELRIGRDADADADQSFVEEHRAGIIAGDEIGLVGIRRIRAIELAEDRVASASQQKPQLDAFGRDRPAILGRVTGDTRPPVGSDHFEEGIASVEESAIGKEGLGQPEPIGVSKVAGPGGGSLLTGI